ncbi:hypothetical protein [Gracilibacillus alcaliphilus]|uniref:hypothetical protein n=1 Tax=Gracilibacillus alcaliphilus TaxID=1401441 RepID=UPI001EF96860|nr:hypothetical protein [Gracilibacillus alcaliphilus]MBM7678776.1 thioredoxin reductase [Gracilibacillus alcaliphilus]
MHVRTEAGQDYEPKVIILATGLKDVLPDIEGIHDVYGSSVFVCPFCDGWELKDRSLVYIVEHNYAFHGGKLISNWSKDTIVCTNGKESLIAEEKGKQPAKEYRLWEMTSCGCEENADSYSIFNLRMVRKHSEKETLFFMICSKLLRLPRI